jgi:hypothetical protein
MVTTMVWNYAAYSGTATTVSYSIEFAAAGKFAAPTVVATMERFKNFTVGELNAAALAAGFAPLLKVQSMCVLSLQLVLREVLLKILILHY